MSQRGDVLLFQTVDDGDINVVNGLIDMTPGFETMAYLLLFGGNEDQGVTWWGNIGELDTTLHLVSRTQTLLQALTATPNNLVKIADAAKLDLAPFISKKIASSVEVVATMPGLNKLSLVINIDAFGKQSDFEFTANWEASV